MCKYVISKREAPYPRVRYDSACGFQLVQMEGYEFETQKDSGGGTFSIRTDKLWYPVGKCMKCGELISVQQGIMRKE